MLIRVRPLVPIKSKTYSESCRSFILSFNNQKITNVVKNKKNLEMTWDFSSLNIRQNFFNQSKHHHDYLTFHDFMELAA